MSGIIDSHVHRYPPEVIADPAAWAAARKEPYWAALVAPGGLQGWADRDRMLRDMDAAGVDLAVLQGWYWENQESCDEQNRWHVRWMKEDPDRFVALASVQPRAGKAAVDGLRRALDEGCAGVGELHPWVQDWSLEGEAWAEIAALCVERKLPVCFHATEPVGRAYKGRVETPLMDYVNMAVRFPALKIVLAHWGGGLPFFMMNRWTRGSLANVHFDTAASPLLYDSRVWANAVDMAGADRILFGSDYPLRVYPARQNEPDFSMLADEARRCLPEDCAGSVMSGNARRVYLGG
ncbi:MAG: amidohydrolase family protein [Opitutales bacterium]|jgi:hypothetical protein